MYQLLCTPCSPEAQSRQGLGHAGLTVPVLHVQLLWCLLKIATDKWNSLNKNEESHLISKLVQHSMVVETLLQCGISCHNYIDSYCIIRQVHGIGFHLICNRHIANEHAQNVCMYMYRHSLYM